MLFFLVWVRTVRDPEHRYRTPEEILDNVGEVCARYPGEKRLRLFCRAERPATTSCIIVAPVGVAVQLARAFGTIPFVNTVVASMALAPDFACPGRPGGVMTEATCDTCVRLLPPPDPAPG